MSLNKPRPDYPIYPSTGYFRERAKAFKRPKGRKGRKPKGQRVGSSVSFQDPNFLIIKAQDEARKARELAIAEAQQAQADREERQTIARQQLQLAQGSAQLQAAQAIEATEARRQEALARRDEARAREREARANAQTQREQLRLQREAQQETQRYRAAKLTQKATQGAKRGKAEQEIIGQLRNLSEENERRQGENREIFQQFLASQDRRGDLSLSNIQEQEQTDLPRQQSADDRRDRRQRSVSLDESVASNLTDLELPDEEGFGAGHRTRGTERRKKPKRFEGGATEAEIAQAGGIVGQTPRELKTEPKPEPEPQAEQRPKLKAGEVRAGKAGGRAPLAKKAQTPKTQQGTIGLDLFGSSPAGKAFAEEVKKSEEALRAAAERAKPKLELKLSSEEEIAQQLGQTKKKGGGRK